MEGHALLERMKKLEAERDAWRTAYGAQEGLLRLASFNMKSSAVFERRLRRLETRLRLIEVVGIDDVRKAEGGSDA